MTTRTEKVFKCKLWLRERRNDLGDLFCDGGLQSFAFLLEEMEMGKQTSRAMLQ